MCVPVLRGSGLSKLGFEVPGLMLAGLKCMQLAGRFEAVLKETFATSPGAHRVPSPERAVSCLARRWLATLLSPATAPRAWA